MTFWSFLKDELYYPLCETSKVFAAIFEAVGSMFDQLVSDAYIVLRQFYPDHADNVELFASERGILRFPNESQEFFLKRVKYAYQFYAGARYQSGIEEIIQMFTDKEFIITPGKTGIFIIGRSNIGAIKIGGRKFSYVITFYESLDDDLKSYLTRVLRKYIGAYIAFSIIVKKEYTGWVIGKSKIGSIKMGGNNE